MANDAMTKSIEFVLYPAIDLRAGAVVRLRRGDPRRQTVYSRDPAAVAEQWIRCGARWLHVVNLDGAFGEAAPRNLLALRRILEVCRVSPAPVAVQFGGGLRSLEMIETALSQGVSRAVLGTAAIESPELVARAVEKFGAGRIGVGIDVLENAVRIRGWAERARRSPLALAAALGRLGVRTIVYTNIARDGVGAGVDMDAAKNLARASGLEVIASGGTASLADVRAVRAAGLAGLIIGRALYDGQIDFREALRC